MAATRKVSLTLGANTAKAVLKVLDKAHFSDGLSWAEKLNIEDARNRLKFLMRRKGIINDGEEKGT